MGIGDSQRLFAFANPESPIPNPGRPMTNGAVAKASRLLPSPLARSSGIQMRRVTLCVVLLSLSCLAPLAVAQDAAAPLTIEQAMADPDTPLSDGVEVAFFPPVTGG